MKIRDGFMLREVAGQWIVVPLGENVANINGIMALSVSAALLWRKLEVGVAGCGELADVLLGEYMVDKATALADSEEFVEILRSKELLE